MKNSGGGRRRGCERRGFEVNLHDLNHDGRLFADKDAFLRHARRINDYAREFGCEGFRSGAMYREQGWFGAFEFSYDMSVPNAAHLEPQRGGCCTVMPYFVGNILELPLDDDPGLLAVPHPERLFDDAVERADPLDQRAPWPD